MLEKSLKRLYTKMRKKKTKASLRAKNLIKTIDMCVSTAAVVICVQTTIRDIY